MNITEVTRNAVLGALAFTLAPAAAVATTGGEMSSETRDDDDGFDMGWLGLLGLAGLLGLKRKDNDHLNNNNNRR